MLHPAKVSKKHMRFHLGITFSSSTLFGGGEGGAGRIQRREIKRLDLRSLWSKEQGLGSQAVKRRQEWAGYTHKSLNMQNAAADVTVLPAYAGRTSNMTDQ